MTTSNLNTRIDDTPKNQDRTPNAQTLAAMRELENGGGTLYANLDDFLSDKLTDKPNDKPTDKPAHQLSANGKRLLDEGIADIKAGRYTVCTADDLIYNLAGLARG